MVSIKSFKDVALGFDNVSEQPHFEKQSYRVNKKIFSTLDEKKKIVVVKLSEIDQSVFCAFDKHIVYPVPGAWGRRGWTMIELDKIPKQMLIDALKTSYEHVVNSKK